MPRKRSSLWLRPLELLSIATGARPKKVAGRTRPAAKKAAPKVASAKTPQKTAGKITRRAPTPAASVRSAKRTRTAHAARAASDTPPGTWLRSFHSAGPSAGRLVNHLAYALYLPAAPAATAALPVVVMLHGCKQTAESFAAGTRMCRLAERAGFAVLFPEQAKTAHAHRCWHWHGDATQSEAAAVVSLVDAIVRHHGFDRDRIYVAGLSAGAGLAAALAIRYPERFAAVGLHSGPAIAPPSSAMAAMSLMRRGIRDDPLDALDACADVASYPGMPALVVHGALDTVVTDRNATQLGIAFARLNRARRRTRRDPRRRTTQLRARRCRLRRLSEGRAARRQGVHRPPAAACMERRRPARAIPFRDGAGRERDVLAFLSSSAPQATGVTRDARGGFPRAAGGDRVTRVAPAPPHSRGRRRAGPASGSGRWSRAPARSSRRSCRDGARRSRATPTARAPCPARPASW